MSVSSRLLTCRKDKGFGQISCCLVLVWTVAYVTNSVLNYRSTFNIKMPITDVNLTRASWSKNSANQETEVKHVAFLKVHKTGSSTVQNIFLRFGHTRYLTFIQGSITHNECGHWPNCISLNNSITQENIVPPPKNKTFEILCSHVVYDKTQFSKYLPPDTHYIGLVREPIHRLESAIVFFKLLQSTNYSVFADNPIKYDHALLNNRMAFEFGFRKELFPDTNKTYPTELEQKQISEYADQIIKDFTLILINERLDESLVLMKRLLGWKTQDILYRIKLSRRHVSFTAKYEAVKLRQYLYLDYLLYDSAQQALDNKIARTGPGFYDEVNEFKKANDLVIRFCDNRRPNQTKRIPGTPLIDKFIVDKTLCENIKRGENSYLSLLRKLQYGNITTY